MAQVKESLSIEETNKIRISLGLKPLPTPDNQAGGQEQELDPDQKAELNYTRHREAEEQAIESNRIKERVLRAKENRERLAKLSGRGLGELEPDQQVDDLKKWVKQHKKKQSKKIDPILAAKKKEQELNADETEYSTRDLEGLKVGHDLKELESSLMDQEMVLTLKDSRILDGEDDELENVELAEHTRTKEAVELKRKGNQAGQYTGYDDDEFLAPGQSQKVLSKYSDTIDGKQEKSFKLGDHMQLDQNLSPSNDAHLNQNATGLKITKKETAEILNKDLINLEYSKTVGSDYVQEGEAGFKKKTKKNKPKKAKQRAPTSTVAMEQDETTDKNDSKDAMQVDETPKPVQSTEPDVIDDEEVQAAMSRMRREVGKLRRKKQQQQTSQKEDETMKSESDHQEMGAPVPSLEATEEDEDDGRLVIDDASEFIRTISLQQERLAEMKKREAEKNKKKHVSLEPSLQAIPESEHADSPIDEEEERRVLERLMAGDEVMATAKSETNEVGEVKEAEESDTYGGTGAEKYVLGGMAATLSLLKSQGLIKPLTPEEREKERLYKDKVAWLIEQRRRDALREAEKERTKKMGDAKDQATREYENRMREAAMAKEAMEAYRHYKPDVEIKYNDEFGRELTQKEAWKALSHKFHGKGSGKAKTEKRIKKIEEEKKLAAMASGDTPTGTNEAFRKRQEKLGSATMVLSVGNKGSAPHQEEFLSSLSKPSTSNNSKKTKGNNKEGNSRGGAGQKHTISAGPDLMNGLGSQINSGFSLDGFRTPSGLMAPRKAGFKPIASSSSSSTSQQPQQPPPPSNNLHSKPPSSLSHSIASSFNHSSSSKISIGLADNKRKADHFPNGPPQSKRTT